MELVSQASVSLRARMDIMSPCYASPQNTSPPVSAGGKFDIVKDCVACTVEGSNRGWQHLGPDATRNENGVHIDNMCVTESGAHAVS